MLQCFLFYILFKIKGQGKQNKPEKQQNIKFVRSISAVVKSQVSGCGMLISVAACLQADERKSISDVHRGEACYRVRGPCTPAAAGAEGGVCLV